MSSLWSIIRKRREIRYDPDQCSLEAADLIFKDMLDSQPHLINISEQVNALYDDVRGTIKLADLDATPCFDHIWMEWIRRKGGRRIGVYIRRCAPFAVPDAASDQKMIQPIEGSKHFVQFYFFAEQDGYPMFHGSFAFYVDALGHPLEGNSFDAHPDDLDTLTCWAYVVGDVLTTINTRGTHIDPPFPDRHAQIKKPDRAPCSVWHTIHVPRFARPPLDAAVVSPEILERREHWVRGHRKDYRQGAGLFGRIHTLVWVPEHQRGNAELGTVMQSYAVERPVKNYGAGEF